MDRELKIALYWSGRQPDMAHQANPKYSVDEYTAAINDEEFINFAADYDKNFIDGVDGLLLGRLQAAADALVTITPDHKNYPAIMREYKLLLDRTRPLIERLAQIQADSKKFDGLELIIKGAPNVQAGTE